MPARRETNSRQDDNAGGMHGVFSWRVFYGQGEGWKDTIPGYMHEDMQYINIPVLPWTCLGTKLTSKSRGG